MHLLRNRVFGLSTSLYLELDDMMSHYKEILGNNGKHRSVRKALNAAETDYVSAHIGTIINKSENYILLFAEAKEKLEKSGIDTSRLDGFMKKVNEFAFLGALHNNLDTAIDLFNLGYTEKAKEDIKKYSELAKDRNYSIDKLISSEKISIN